jgi:S-adenosylmethionine synthetase
MKFIYGDSATFGVRDRKFPIDQIVEAAASEWIRTHLPMVDPAHHVVFQSELRPGSIQLSESYRLDELISNDTCVGSGYAPLSEVERLVLELERRVNSSQFKSMFPETGQDVKVSAVRRDRTVELALSLAFIGSRVQSERSYFDAKHAITDDLRKFALHHSGQIDCANVYINNLDRPGIGAAGMYLTVLGTSAEGADGGQIGRGNRVSGLISSHRPSGTGAAAGKNPARNAGKIYNLFARELAGRIHKEICGLDEVYVTMGSRIGDPVCQPYLVSVQVVGREAKDSLQAVRTVIEDAIGELPIYIAGLIRDPPGVC